MIFPFPYTKGEKRYPIMGYHETVYALTATHIGQNLGLIDGKAYYMDGRIKTVNGYDLNLSLPNEDIIVCNWEDIFATPYGSDPVGGFVYVLLPNSSPTYPTYHYKSSVAIATNWEDITPVSPGASDAVMTQDMNFILSGQSYQMIKWKGYGNDIKATAIFNEKFNVYNY